MLSRIRDIVKNSESVVDLNSGTIFCNNYSISDIDCLSFLDKQGCFENTIYVDELKTGYTISLEISLHHLATLGFYHSFEFFILKNQYDYPNQEFLILDINYFSSERHDDIDKYKATLDLINALNNLARHAYNEAGINNVIVFREDKSIFIPFNFNSYNVEQVKIEDVVKIKSIINVFEANDDKKKFLFINELIDYLALIKEKDRFTCLLSNISEYYEICNNAYLFYLRDFSYNKLKIELDSKALEYTQKIQSVINEAQTKLIAIPTVFVLACATFDYTNDLITTKNIATIISLFIFAIIIQQFLNNQKSSLSFIKDNIASYKDTFRNNDIEKISSKFSLVEEELKKQKRRLLVVEIILWLIPISLLILWLFLIGFSLFSYLLTGSTLIFILLKTIV